MTIYEILSLIILPITGNSWILYEIFKYLKKKIILNIQLIKLYYLFNKKNNTSFDLCIKTINILNYITNNITKKIFNKIFEFKEPKYDNKYINCHKTSNGDFIIKKEYDNFEIYEGINPNFLLFIKYSIQDNLIRISNYKKNLKYEEESKLNNKKIENKIENEEILKDFLEYYIKKCRNYSKIIFYLLYKIIKYKKRKNLLLIFRNEKLQH